MDVLQEVLNRVQSQGYATVSSFLNAYPGEPYGKLLKIIATRVEGKNHFDLPIFAIKEAHRREALLLGATRDYAKDTLVRSLRDTLGSGWKKGTSWEERRAQAYSSWAIPAGADGPCADVWRVLKQLDPPVGWRPKPVGDELIDKAFDIAWPIEQATDATE